MLADGRTGRRPAGSLTTGRNRRRHRAAPGVGAPGPMRGGGSRLGSERNPAGRAGGWHGRVRRPRQGRPLHVV